MDFAVYAVTTIIAYLLGSIPTGYLVAKAKGVDIRTLGSGNIGATNVFRFLGKQAGVFVLLADAFKGYAACRWGGELALLVLGGAAQSGGARNEGLAILAGVGAVMGHNYTCWLKFKGGKGIATSAGVFAALAPWALLICLGIWGSVFALSRYVSLASVVAAGALPLVVWLTKGGGMLIGLTTVLAALAIYRHKGNIQRLLNGTENRIGGKKPQNESTS